MRTNEIATVQELKNHLDKTIRAKDDYGTDDEAYIKTHKSKINKDGMLPVTIDGLSLKHKGDSVSLTINAQTTGGPDFATTDKIKVYATTGEPTIVGTKVTCTKSTEVKATLSKDKKSVVVTASKDITQPAYIYVVYTNSVEKKCVTGYATVEP